MEAPKTWDEFVTVCEKLDAAGYQPVAVSGDFMSFWAEQMGWLAQIYVDQTTRSQINLVRAQEGDYCYDPDVDGKFVYDPTDPHNDDTPANVNNNNVRFWKGFIKDGTIRADTPGMKAVWTNMAKIFPKYSGGDNFYGTDKNGEKTLFYQQKAAIYLDGSWFFGDYLNTMNSIDAGETVTIGEDDKAVELEGLQKFTLGTFAMPSMEGDVFEAKARTIEVATGFLSAIKKDIDHDEMVVDFLKFYTSPEGYSAFIGALIENGGVPDGLPLVKGITLDGELGEMFANIEYIGNVQKGLGQKLARGIDDNQEALRAWYGYTSDFLNGKISIDEWGDMNQENQMKYGLVQMEIAKITMEDLDKMEKLCYYIKNNSLCGLGQTAPNPVLSTLRYFKNEYIAHVQDKKCPAGVCQDLLTYKIIDFRCKGCTACARGCPVGAISGTVKQPHTIDTAKCIKCGACMAKCKFGAIIKE